MSFERSPRAKSAKARTTAVTTPKASGGRTGRTAARERDAREKAAISSGIIHGNERQTEAKEAHRGVQA